LAIDIIKLIYIFLSVKKNMLPILKCTSQDLRSPKRWSDLKYLSILIARER